LASASLERSSFLALSHHSRLWPTLPLLRLSKRPPLELLESFCDGDQAYVAHASTARFDIEPTL